MDHLVSLHRVTMTELGNWLGDRCIMLTLDYYIGRNPYTSTPTRLGAERTADGVEFWCFDWYASVSVRIAPRHRRRTPNGHEAGSSNDAGRQVGSDQ